MTATTNWRIIKPTPTENYVLNPSAETTGNFAAAGSATVARSTTYQKYGLYSYSVQTSLNGEGISLTLKQLTNSVHFLSFRIRGILPNLRAIIGPSIKEPEFIETISPGWDLYGCTFSSAACNGQTTLYLIQQGEGAGDFYVDGVQIEPLPYWTSYCDGTQRGCYWSGAEHATSSLRSALTPYGGIPQDLYLEYKFFLQKTSKSDVASLPIDSYSVLPGGQLDEIKLESTQLSLVGKFVADSKGDLYQSRQDLFELLKSNKSVMIQFLGATQKEIELVYQSGLEGDTDVFYGAFSTPEIDWVESFKFIEEIDIKFLAPLPYWTEVGESAIALDVSDSDTFRFVAARLKSTGQWNGLGPPAVSSGPVHAIVEDSIYVYFGGNFTNFDNIAAADYVVRYHKETGVWSALGGGLNNVVYTLALAPNGDLYIGGQFTNAGGIANADYLTRWDGTQFNAVGNPSAGAAAITWVRKIVFDRTGILFIGGDFLNWAGLASADNIVSWDGNSYSALSTGLDNGVRALTVGLDNALYVGGVFTNRLNTWDGSSFTALGGGITGTSVLALAIDPRNNTLYLGGVFTAAGALLVTNLASWNGTIYSQLDGGITSTVVSWGINTITVGPDGIVYIAGALETAGGITLPDKVVRWNGFTFAHLDINFPGSNANVQYVLPGNDQDVYTKNRYTLWVAFSTSGTSTKAGAVTPENEGNTKAFPKIVYERDGGTTASIVTIETLKNELDGKELLFNYGLLDGERLTIDLSSNKKPITSSFFGLVPDAILKNSDIGEWGLLPGTNLITSFVLQSGVGITVTAYMLWKDSFYG